MFYHNTLMGKGKNNSVPYTHIDTGDISYLFKNVLLDEECDSITKLSIEKGKDDHTIGDNANALKNQKRLKYEDYGLTQRIYDRIKQQFEKLTKNKYVATNTMITYVDYHEGGVCPVHLDDKVDNGIGKNKYITVIVYLTDLDGGRTYFIKNNSKTKLYANAKKGDLLIFHGQKIKHGCEKVIGNKKIIIFGIELE